MALREIICCSTLIHTNFSPWDYFEKGFLNLPGIISKFYNPLSVHFEYKSQVIYGLSHFALIQEPNEPHTLLSGTMLTDAHYYLLTISYDGDFAINIQTRMEERYRKKYGDFQECRNQFFLNLLKSHLEGYYKEYKRYDI